MRAHAWTARLGLGFLLVAFVASACAGPTTPPAAGTQAPTTRDTIVIGMSQEPDVLYFPIGSMMVATNVGGAIYKGLTERDDENKYIPRMATETPSIEKGTAELKKTADGKDQLVVHWKLRDSVKFSNGDPVTAEDIKFSWELYLNESIPIVSRVTARRYERIDVKSATEFDVVYKPGELDPLYFSFCCTIVPKKVVGALDPKTLKESSFIRQPIYPGPYRVQEWQPGSSITVVANDDFWLGKPKTKTLIFKFIPDTNTMLAQARAGQVDVVTNDATSLDQIPELDKLPSEAGMTPHYTPAATWEHIDFNLRDPKDLSKPHPILGDLKVRQAIAHGVDRGKITQQILYGKTKPLHTFLVPGVNFAAAQDSDITVYSFDQNKAKQLLEEAGWKVGADGVREKGGQKLELKLQSTSGNKMREQTTQVMANDLKAIGVKVNIELLVASKYFATRGEGPLSAGTFDLGLYAWVSGEDPQPATFLYFCDQAPTKANNYGGQNYPGYCSPNLDKVMLEGNNKLKQDERKPLYIQAQKLWTADLPVLTLYQRLNIDLRKTALQNFKSTPTNTPATWNSFEWVLPR